MEVHYYAHIINVNKNANYVEEDLFANTIVVSLSGKSAVVKEYVIMEDRNYFVKTVKDLRYVVMGSRSLIVNIITQ